MLDWNDLQYLLALSEHRTLPAAAERLGVNRTTVGRRIDQLEKLLGARLVEKVGRDLALTDAGREAVTAAQLIDGELQSLERRVFGRDQQLEGKIRLTSPQGIATLLAPCLAAFQDEYPKLNLHVSATNTVEDLELMEADIAIRMTSQPPENLVGRLVGQPRTAIYASRAVAEKLQHMKEVDYVGSGFFGGKLPSIGDITLNQVITTNFIDLIRAFIACGKGVGGLPCYMAEGDERLVRISDPVPDQLPQMWLLYHPRLRSQLRIRKLVNHLTAELNKLRPVIEATGY